MENTFYAYSQHRKCIIFLALSIFFIQCKPSSNKDSSSETKPPQTKVLSVEQQVEEIMEIWPGVYNNDKQIAAAKKRGEDVWMFNDEGEGGWLHVQSHYIKMDLPEVGDNVLYVEEYRNQSPDSIYRQRIYTIAADDSTGIVKVKMWTFKDKKKYVGAWKDPSSLNGLRKDEISVYPEICDLLVSRIDNKYQMKFNDKDCAFGDKCFNYEVILSDNLFRYRDKITSVSSGETITTAAEYAFHDLNRIR